MSRVDYVVRDNANAVQYGALLDADAPEILVSNIKDVSLNISPASVKQYRRSGDDLIVVLTNGEEIVLNGYYEDNGGERHLFLSENGQLQEVILAEGDNGALYARYDMADVGGKYSAYDDLVFLDIAAIEPVVAPLIAPALGGLGLLGGGVAAVAGAGVIGKIIDNDTPPNYDLTVNDAAVDQVIGGTGPDTVNIDGTGTPGSIIDVVIGGQTQTTTVDDNGNWTVIFAPGDLPIDGIYVAEVTETLTDGSTETINGPNVDIDTTPPLVNADDGTQAAGDFVNAASHGTGATISGTGEVGANISVEIDGVTHTTTVDANGDWSVNFSTSEIATGEYTTDITITATDARGNSTVVTEILVVDTVAPVADIATVETDDVINAAESADGVVLSGTGEAGSTVQVEFQGLTQQLTVAADGTWAANFAASDIAQGTYDSTITVTSTDSYGNTSTISKTVHVDTDGLATLDTPIEGDNVMNAVEHADGVTLTGTSEAGSSVVVTMAGVTHTVVVDSSGNWTVDFTSAEIPGGDYDTTVQVSATDAAGNVTTTSGSLHIDTVANVTLNNKIEGDDMVNATEHADGVVLSGTADANSSVTVTLNGISHTVTADANGVWSTNYTSAEIPTGEYDAPITVTAIDVSGNSTTTTGTVQIDTSIIATLDGPVAGDNTVNATEHAGGITLNGTADAGATVVVTVAGVSHTVVAASNGTWTSDFSNTEIPSGTYDATISVVATDAAGNSTSTSGSLHIDTEISASIDANQAGDNTINNAEDIAGVTLTGKAEAGSSVVVSLAGVSHTVVADGSGNWSSNFTSAEIPNGEYTAPITITATDTAGNVATAASSVTVDTTTSVSINTGFAGGDATINAAEAASGITLTGSAEAGASVMVTLAGVTQAATVDANGNWTATYAAGTLPAGEYNSTVVVNATDAAGNSASSSTAVIVDTNLSNLTIDPNQTADDVVNAAEYDAGLTLTGTTEIGSSVQVTVQGVTQTATVDASGNWSVTYAPGALPTGEYEATATVTATDAAGNIATVSDTFDIDTLIDTPDIASVTFAGGDVRRISTDLTGDDFTINTLAGDGTVGAPAATETTDPVFGNEYTFASPISDGTHLVVSSADAAGNKSGTLVVLEDNATNASTIENAGLAQFDIQSLNLDYAVDTSLTLSEAQIKAMSGTTDTLLVNGGTDDTINLAGAVKSASQTIDGQNYDVYTIGSDGATLVVEQDVNVII